MTQRICIHGHFYQPPRANPWTGRIDPEPSAAPWPNWNARIADECYGPNTKAAVLDGDGTVDHRVDNFAHISFNVGPTLLAWLEDRRPGVYASIVAADRAGAARFAGHGGAMAQAFDHLILPLASSRDRQTQVRWGIEDFTRRFGRRPVGMWLPETAVDAGTLEALAAEGIRYTVLAPGQAAAVREPGGEWIDASDDLVASRPFAVPLPSGATISVFFYDGDLARGIAFEGWLHDGAALAQRLLDRAAARSSDAGLAHLATDGESYGHHHRHGEMALARALEHIERNPVARLTTYSEFLASFPPTWEARVVEGSSWSCTHGVARWAGGCDCGTGGTEWNYAWRSDLRRAIASLGSALADLFETEGRRILRDPWAARDDGYGALFGGQELRARWLAEWLLPGAAEDAALRLLQMQRFAMGMQVSCGWFFDDPTGLETRIVLRAAARAVDLAEEAGWAEAVGLRDAVAADLAAIVSNCRDGWTAADEWRRIFAEDRRAEPAATPEGR